MKKLSARWMCALAAAFAAGGLSAAWVDANAGSTDEGAPAGGSRNGVVADAIPFSTRGSYYTVDYVGPDSARPERLPGVWVQTMATEASERFVARLVPYVDGRPVEDVKFECRPWSARIVTPSGAIAICFADPRTLLFRGDSAALSLKIDFHLPAPYQPIYEVPVRGGGKAVLANGFKNAAKFLLDVRSGTGEVDCEWGGRNAKTSALFVRPEGGLPLELSIRDVAPEWDGSLPKAAFDESAKARRAEFEGFLARLPSVAPKYSAARERAAHLLWSAAVAPRGYIRRESILMSKLWMNSVWSWDHAFNAICLADTDFDLAWNQLMCVFDNQDASGQVPDATSDGAVVFSFVKPPIHGWALRRMMRGREIPRPKLEEAYARLSAVTRWWFERRDRDGNGLAEYDHGNDSGWDNSTAFLMLPPVETPELQAYLAVQMDVLADVAEKLGRADESAAWRERAKTLAAKTEKLLFDDKGRPLVRQVATGKTASPPTLQTRLAMLAGDLFSEKVRRELSREVREEGYGMGHSLASEPRSEWFRRNGYWRGPVWAPAVMLAVDGLRACGDEDFAREAAREFCDTASKSKFAENFDPISGEPLCDPAYTWTASVFLVLAHELSEPCRDKVLLQALPARDWREATPLGNGRLGALVHGRASDERVTLNHEALYNWAGRGEMPDLSGLLPKVRALLAEGRFAEANRLYPDALKASGYKGATGKFFPTFDLCLRCGTDGVFRDYARELDMTHGVCTVRWADDGGDWERTSFVSCATGAGGPFVMRVRRDGRPFSAEVSLPRHDLIDFPDYGGWDDFSAEAGARALLSTVKTPDGLSFCGMARILSTDGKVAKAEGAKGRIPSLHVESAHELVLLVDVRDSAISFADLEASLAQLCEGRSFDALLAGHSAEFSKRFCAATFSLGAADAPRESNERLLLDAYANAPNARLVGKMADFGRYLLLSSSGFGCARPANLQGVWNGDYSPAWGATYFLDENVAMMYWQALRGGMSETLLPLFDLLDRWKDDFRTNARRLWGCRGLVLPLYMGDRGGLKGDFQPHCVYWTGAGAWIASFHWDYWLWTGDRAFLRDRAWPFLREVALFYEDFLYEGHDGLLHAAPAVSPENSPVVEGGAKVDVCVDPTMEIALVRELLNHALAAAAELGIDDAQTARWRAMLAKLPPYRTNERGALREWLDPRFGDNDHHRHLSHLYPLFPGREIAPHRDAALFAAAKKATEARLATGLPDQTGWSLAHMACVWARLGEGDRALGCLEQLLRCCTGPNLFTRHNDWRGMGVTLEMLHGTTPPIQLDAAYGFSAAVQEMLLGIDEASLRILPALPAAWERGSMKGLRAPGGVKVDISWGNGEWQAAISLGRDFPARGIDVYTPGSPEPRRVDLKPGDVVRLFGLLK